MTDGCRAAKRRGNTLECGDSQGEDIENYFDGKASSSEIMYDFNHIDRVVKIIV